MIVAEWASAMKAQPLGTTASTQAAPESCQVLPGFTGVAVQGLLFSICVGSLLLKWWWERPRRTLQVFFLDSSKQFVGAGVIHCLNMVCAMVFSQMKANVADECAWYWVNIMIDTTFGVLVCWVFLKFTERLFGYDSGYYGKEASTGINWEANPDYSKWGSQIMVWSVIVSLMKVIVVAVMYAFAPMWQRISITCTHWIQNRTERLVFVMILTPTFMNMFQFWVTDSFLKYATSSKKDMLPSTVDETISLRTEASRARSSGTTEEAAKSA
jgi:hypothetical protein